MFLVRLRYVKQHMTLTEVVQLQHNLRDIPKKYIEDILKGKTKQRVLLMLDGYDEYSPGTNKDIDEAIEFGIGNCFLTLTSRSGEYLFGPNLESRMIDPSRARSRSSRICTFIALYR